MGILKKLLTVIRGGATEVGEAIVDTQALRILDQEIRDAENALAQARQELVRIMGQHKVATQKCGEMAAKISDLEAKAMKALDAGREDLATEVAEAIAHLTTQHDAEKQLTSEFSSSANSMRQTIDKAEKQIRELRQQADLVKARDSVQKAQSKAQTAATGAQGNVGNAASTLERLKSKQQQQQAQFEAQEALESERTGADLDQKLRDAGITPQQDTANAVLERLKASRNTNNDSQ